MNRIVIVVKEFFLNLILEILTIIKFFIRKPVFNNWNLIRNLYPSYNILMQIEKMIQNLNHFLYYSQNFIMF